MNRCIANLRSPQLPDSKATSVNAESARTPESRAVSTQPGPEADSCRGAKIPPKCGNAITRRPGVSAPLFVRCVIEARFAAALAGKSTHVGPLSRPVPVWAGDPDTPRPYDRPMATDAFLTSQIAESAYADVSAAVRKWPGFGAFGAGMRAFPETEVFLAGGVLRDYFRTGKCAPKDFDFFLGGPRVDNFIEHLARHGALSRGPF